MVSNRDTACAFRGLRPGWPLLVPWDCFSTTRDNPEERDAIEIEGDLIEIAGEIDIARMKMIKDMINVIDVIERSTGWYRWGRAGGGEEGGGGAPHEGHLGGDGGSHLHPGEQ